jgi:hypothetical protein
MTGSLMNSIFAGSLELKAGDWLILLCCLMLIPLAWSLTRHQPGTTTAIEITAGNYPPIIYSIKDNQQINITGKLGSSSIEIRDGKVRFADSPCNSKLCILSGWHHFSGDHILCLPNEVGITLLSQNDRFDGINF